MTGNPFTITFGIEPSAPIKRIKEAEKITSDFRHPFTITFGIEPSAPIKKDQGSGKNYL